MILVVIGSILSVLWALGWASGARLGLWIHLFVVAAMVCYGLAVALVIHRRGSLQS